MEKLKCLLDWTSECQWRVDRESPGLSKRSAEVGKYFPEVLKNPEEEIIHSAEVLSAGSLTGKDSAVIRKQSAGLLKDLPEGLKRSAEALKSIPERKNSISPARNGLSGAEMRPEKCKRLVSGVLKGISVWPLALSG